MSRHFETAKKHLLSGKTVFVLCFLSAIISYLIYEVVICDNFNYCKFTLVSSKSTYQIGDTISLDLKIIPLKKHKQIRVYKDITRSLDLLFRNAGYGEDISLIEYVRPEPSDDKIINESDTAKRIRVVRITPEKPFELQVTGMIEENENKIIIRFQKFGKIRIPRTFSGLRITGSWNPVHPAPADAFEYFTDTIYIYF